jgi:serine/threonine protein phosphatase PrpC
MSRAIGDLQYKNPINTSYVGGTTKSKRAAAAAPEARGDFISNEAHIKSIQLNSDRRYVLMLSTDGVSDVTDGKMLMDHVMKAFAAGSRASDIATEVTARIAGRPESDNCTSVLVFLDGTKS